MTTPMRTLERVLACALFLWSSWVLGITVDRAGAQDGVPFSFTLRKPGVTLHEPVSIDLKVENRLSEKITLDLGVRREANFQFSVTKPDGTEVSPPRLEEGGFGRSGNIWIEPGDTFRQHVLVNKWYQFLEAGTYRIRLRLVDIALKTESGVFLSNQVVSSPMVLQISPADPSRLSAVCESLVQSARTSRGYAKRAEDAVALSYIVDPVAIPHLANLAKTPQLERIGILGLARIANVEGIEPVISKLERKDPELEEAIRSALDCIKQGCHGAD